MEEKEMKEKDMAAAPSRETQISIAASSSYPGFRFSPTDEELISYYLKKKMEGCEKSVEIISEIEICRYEPWDLPAKSIIQSQSEWFFFSARGRKYPHGSQSRRATELGYWKATRKERDVKSGNTVIGTKRTLVFHTGRAPKGERTEWIMHEYSMHRKSQNTPVICRLRRNTVFRHGDASNRESVSEGQVIATENSNNTTSVGETNHMGVPEGDNAAMGAQARRTSSSYDSHSIEPMDATSESNQKLWAEDAKAESSINRKESDPEDDFYADILKDDIIKLDESAMSVAPNALMESRLHTETEPQQSMQAFLAPAPVLGLANRRVRFNEPNLEEQLPGNSSILSAMESLWIENDKKQEEEEEYNAGKDKGTDWSTDWSSWWSPSCLITTSFAGKTIGRRVGAVVVVLFLVLLAVLLIINSGKSR